MDPQINSSGGMWDNFINIAKDYKNKIFQEINEVYVELKIKTKLFTLNSEVESKIQDIVNRVIKRINVQETQLIRNKYEMTRIRKIVNESIRESTARVIQQISQKQNVAHQKITTEQVVMDDSFLDIASNKIKEGMKEFTFIGDNPEVIDFIPNHLKEVVKEYRELAQKETKPVLDYRPEMQIGKRLTTSDKAVNAAKTLLTLRGALYFWKETMKNAKDDYEKAISSPYINEKGKARERLKLTTTKIAVGLASRLHYCMTFPFEILKNIAIELPVNLYHIVVLIHKDRVSKVNRSILYKTGDIFKASMKALWLMTKASIGKLLATSITSVSYITMGTRKINMNPSAKSIPPTLQQTFPSLKIEISPKLKSWHGIYYPVFDHQYKIAPHYKYAYILKVFLIQIQNLGHPIAKTSVNLSAEHEIRNMKTKKVMKVNEPSAKKSIKRNQDIELGDLGKRRRRTVSGRESNQV